jgi:hypothetical protein
MFFHAHNFVPYHLAYESRHAEKVAIAIFYGSPRNYSSTATSAYMLPGPGVVRQWAKGNARAVCTLPFIFRGLAGADPSDDGYFIECFQVTAPR